MLSVIEAKIIHERKVDIGKKILKDLYLEKIRREKEDILNEKKYNDNLKIFNMNYGEELKKLRYLFSAYMIDEKTLNCLTEDMKNNMIKNKELMKNKKNFNLVKKRYEYIQSLKPVLKSNQVRLIKINKILKEYSLVVKSVIEHGNFKYKSNISFECETINILKMLGYKVKIKLRDIEVKKSSNLTTMYNYFIKY